MADVFISYSRKDKAFIQRLHAALAAINRDVWVDWEDIPLTADWWKEICTGIEAADTFIFIISPDSAQSAVCRKEIDHAIENNKRIVPILWRELLETADKTALHSAISSHNWIYFNDTTQFDPSFQSLIGAIDTDLNHVREHTRLLVRALEWDSGGRGNSSLLTGTTLQQAEGWLAASVGKNPPPAAFHTAYISASRRAANRRQQTLIGSLTVGLVIAIALAIFGLTQSQLAQTALSTSEARGTQAAAAAATAERRALEADSGALAAQGQLVYESGNQPLGLALALQANTIPFPPPQVQRALSDLALSPGVNRRLHPPPGSLSDPIFTPDNRSVVFRLDNQVVVWGIASDSMQKSFTSDEDPAGFYGLSVSPSGKIIFPDLWNIETAQQKIPDFSGNNFFEPRVSPDGARAIASTFVGTNILWDAHTGERIREMENDTGYNWNYTAFSLDSKIIASSVGDGTTILWDAATGDEVRRFKVNINWVNGIAFSPDGKNLLYAGCIAYEVRFNICYGWGLLLWDIEVGRLLWTSDEGHNDYINTLAVSPHWDTALTGSSDNTLILWNLETGKRLNTLIGHHTAALGAAYSPDGMMAVSSACDLGIANLGCDIEYLESREIIVWDVQTGAEIREIVTNQFSTSNFTLSPDGQTALSPSADHTLTLWDTANGDPLWRFVGHTGDVTSVAFSPSGTKALSGSSDATMILWDIATKQALRTFEGHTDSINGVTFSPDGTKALSGSSDHRLMLWEVATGEKLLTFTGHEDEVRDVAFSADGQRIFSWSEDNELIVWDAQTAQILHHLAVQDDSLYSAAFSPDGKLIASGFSSGNLILWDAATGARLRNLVAHQDTVYSVAFSPNGKRLLSSEWGGRLFVWNIETGERLQTLRAANTVDKIAFSPDGRSVFTGIADDRIIIWRLDSLPELADWTFGNREVQPITCDERQVFNVKPLCSDLPTQTPYLTWTPALESVTPTLNATDITMTPTATVTPTPTVTFTPSATATPTATATFTAIGTAQKGINRGEASGGAQTWIYMGQEGEILTITLETNSRSPELFESGLTLLMPDGDELASAFSGINRVGNTIPAAVENVQLPVSGLYTIEVGVDEGEYTLTLESSSAP